MLTGYLKLTELNRTEARKCGALSLQLPGGAEASKKQEPETGSTNILKHGSVRPWYLKIGETTKSKQCYKCAIGEIYETSIH